MKKIIIGIGLFAGSLLTGALIAYASPSVIAVFQGGTATTTAPVSQVLYGGTGPVYQSVATSSIGAGTGLSFSGTSGAQIGGTNGTFSVNSSQSIATLSNLTTNGFVQTSGGVGTLGVQTFPCSLAQGCTNATSFTTSGNGVYYNGTSLLTAPLTSAVVYPFASSTAISASGPIYAGTTNSNFLSVGSSSPWGLFALNPTAGVASNEFVVGSSTATAFLINNTGNVGIASTSPWAQFAVNPIAGHASNQFAIGSSTATNFIVTNAGKTGIGTTTPFATLSVQDSAGVNAFTVGSSTATTLVVNSLKQTGVGTSTPWITNGFTSSSTIASYEAREATSTSQTIDFNNSNQSIFQLGTSAITFTFSNYADHPGRTKRILVCNPHAGTPGGLTWPNGSVLIWNGDTTPTPTATIDKCDVYSFITTIATSTANAAIVLGAQTANF